MLFNLLIIRNFKIHTIAGNYRIVPSIFGESLPEITGLAYNIRKEFKIIKVLKNKTITGFCRIT